MGKIDNYENTLHASYNRFMQASGNLFFNTDPKATAALEAEYDLAEDAYNKLYQDSSYEVKRLNFMRSGITLVKNLDRFGTAVEVYGMTKDIWHANTPLDKFEVGVIDAAGLWGGRFATGIGVAVSGIEGVETGGVGFALAIPTIAAFNVTGTALFRGVATFTFSFGDFLYEMVQEEEKEWNPTFQR